MGSLALRSNLVVTPAAVILRRPGELGFIYTALLMAIGVAAFGLVYSGARPVAYVSIAFGGVATLLAWVRQGGGIYVEAETVTLRNGRRRVEICAAPPVAKLLVQRVGSAWENYEEIRFLDKDGSALGHLKNEVQSGRSPSHWSHPDLEDFAAANRWDCEIDASKDHLTRSEPS